ncbi:hypothetical protein AB4304_13940 [Vibrio breoganii]
MSHVTLTDQFGISYIYSLEDIGQLTIEEAIGLSIDGTNTDFPDSL